MNKVGQFWDVVAPLVSEQTYNCTGWQQIKYRNLYWTQTKVVQYKAFPPSSTVLWSLAESKQSIELHPVTVTHPDTMWGLSMSASQHNHSHKNSSRDFI